MSDQTTGSIVGGVVGAVIGGYFGGPTGAVWGYSIGSALGGYATAEDTESEGRRVEQLQVQSSTYGRPVPEVFGAARIAGNVIWLEDNRITEHVVEEEQGKGGPTHTTTTYEYTASFAVGLCEGPIAGVRRIWADAVLVYDGTAEASAESILAGARVFTVSGPDDMQQQQQWGIKVYTGTEDQQPDPRIEADLGAGEVPAYRGLAYLVIEDMPLGNYGNRLPNITVEVASELGDLPTFVGAWADPMPGHGFYGTWPSMETDSGIVAAQWFEATADGKQRHVGRWTIDGHRVEVYRQGVSDVGVLRTCPNSTHFAVGAGDTGGVYWIVNGTRQWTQIQNTAGLNGPIPSRASPVWSGADAMYYVIPDESQEYYHLARFPIRNEGVLLGGESSGLANDVDVIPDRVASAWAWSEQVYLTRSPNGHIWALGRVGGDWYLVEFDEDLQEVSSRGWYNMLDLSKSGRPFAVVGDWVIGHFAGHGSTRMFRISDQAEVGALDDGGSGATLVDGGPLVVSLGATNTFVYSLNRTAQVSPVPMADIITRLAARAGLSADDIDVSQLDHAIRGFAVSNMGPVQSAVEPLRAVGQFDVVEQGYQIHCMPRGGEAILTLTEQDLAAHEPGEAVPSRIQESRELESALPRQIGVRYQDVDRDYETGHQYAARLATEAITDETVDLQVAMTADEAARLADVLLKERWAGRTQYRLTTPLRHARLMPGDVVAAEADGVAVQGRIAEIDDGPPGLRMLTLVADGPGLYTSQAPGAPGAPPATGALRLTGPTLLTTMNLPVLRRHDDAPGFYVAATGYLSGWRGAQLYRSLDGGESYDTVPPTLQQSAGIGVVNTALGPAPVHVWDRGGSCNVTMISGALSGATDLQVLNGANVLAVEVQGGWEILQFAEATLEADGSYTLSRLIRGRLGTEWAVGRHFPGARVVVLAEDGTIRRVELDEDDVGRERRYKAVSFGNRLPGARAQAFEPTAVFRRPFAVAALQALEQAASGYLRISWLPRTRYGGAWRDGVDVTLTDPEHYRVRISSGGGVLREAFTTSRVYNYTPALQFADGVVSGQALTIAVAQLNDAGELGYEATTEAVGTVQRLPEIREILLGGTYTAGTQLWVRLGVETVEHTATEGSLAAVAAALAAKIEATGAYRASVDGTAIRVRADSGQSFALDAELQTQLTSVSSIEQRALPPGPAAPYIKGLRWAADNPGQGNPYGQGQLDWHVRVTSQTRPVYAEGYVSPDVYSYELTWADLRREMLTALTNETFHGNDADDYFRFQSSEAYDPNGEIVVRGGDHNDDFRVFMNDIPGVTAVVVTRQEGRPPLPEGRPQQVRIRWSGPHKYVSASGELMAGTEVHVVVDGISSSYTVQSGDTEHQLVDGLKAAIDASAAPVTAATEKTTVDGRQYADLLLEADAPNDPFSWSVQVSESDMTVSTSLVQEAQY